MTTIRRLSDDDVKSIFNCVRNNKIPPKQLKFHIIVVGANGLKLSPPSYEYKDGLYVLLKPDKKLKDHQCFNLTTLVNSNKIPSKLTNYVMKEHPEENCPWSLSGPQFSLPTRIQQRYCYPKGDPDYSHKKGGALWTTYDENGKENLDYRLLHVYYSAKRALRDTTPLSEIKKKHGSTKKPRIHGSIFRKDQFPPALCRTPPSFDLVNSHQCHTAEVLLPPSNCLYTSHSGENHDYNYPTWQNHDRFQAPNSNRLVDKSSHDTQYHHLCNTHIYPELYSPDYRGNLSNKNENHSHNSRRYTHSLSTTPDQDTCQQNNDFSNHSRHDIILPVSSCEPLPVDIDIDLFEQTDSLAFSNSIRKKTINYTEEQNSNDLKNSDIEKQIDNFGIFLGDLHKRIQERIINSNESEQCRFVHTLVYWAKRIAQSPLRAPIRNEENAENDLITFSNESLLNENIDCVRRSAKI